MQLDITAAPTKRKQEDGPQVQRFCLGREGLREVVRQRPKMTSVWEGRSNPSLGSIGLSRVDPFDVLPVPNSDTVDSLVRTCKACV